jgi:hypothetical protein
MAPGTVWTSEEKSLLFQDLYVFSCTLYFIRTWLFVLIVLHFAFCFYLQHAAQTSITPAGFKPVIPASDRQ